MQDKKQDKIPRNAEGKAHGIWEKYYDNGLLYYKGLYLNGLEEGFWESYYDNGQLCYKSNFIKGEYIGYYHEYNSTGSIRETKFYAR